MINAFIFCALLLPGEADAVTIRVVNTLEEPVAIKFRVVGKEAWLKDELSLDSAQTKNFALPKGDKFEVVVRDQNKKEIPVGSWDFGKMLAKDAKFEVHVVDAKENPARGSSGVKKSKPSSTDANVRPGSRIGAILRRGRAEIVEVEPAATPDAPRNPQQSVELAVFSDKKYFLIDEFIEGKKEAKSNGAAEQKVPLIDPLQQIVPAIPLADPLDPLAPRLPVPKR